MRLGLGLGLDSARRLRIGALGALAMQFEGVDRDDNSCGLNCGVTGFGVQTSDGSMNVTATIRRSRTGINEFWFGKYGAAVSSQNYLFGVDSSDHLVFAMTNSAPTYVQATGTTALAANTNYTVQGNWNGSVLSVLVNSVQEGTTPALTALQAPDAVTPLTIGRLTWDSGTPASPYPFQGTIANVSMTKGGVLQGRWPLGAINGATTPDTSGNGRDATLVGTNKPILVPYPF